MPRVADTEASVQDIVCIDAKLLIPGRGEPIQDGSLLVRDATIIWVGQTKELPDELSISVRMGVPVLMPGLWDCHVHYFGLLKISVDFVAGTPQALSGIRSARDLVATLNAGVTSVREVGGYGADLSQAVEEGWIPGPSIYSSVSLISTTAGHADNRTEPSCVIHDLQEHGVPLYVCDGIPQCIEAVRVQVRRGSRLIKVATTGGVASADNIHASQFSDEELNAIVGEAHRHGMEVAAHCHGPQGVLSALRAGCKTLEHGSWLSQEAIQMMLKQDTLLVATRSILEWGKAHPGFWPPQSYTKLMEIERANLVSYKKAIRAGVRIALGTDLSCSTQDISFQHGTNASEFGWAVEAGLTPLQAIEAGTANAAETLGRMAPKSGQLRAGFDADMIALDQNPLENIWLLARPEEIKFVWKRGQCVKKQGEQISILPTVR